MTRRALLLVAPLALAACSDSAAPFEPEPGEGPLTAITCRASVASRAVTCAAPTGVSADILVGGQGQYVKLSSADVGYRPDSALFTFAVTVQNLIQQPLATADGTTASANGVRVFFHGAPTATAVANPSGDRQIEVLGDGIDVFTASNQPYFQYTGAALGGDGILARNETSSPRTWRLRVPANVQSFVFTVYVAADVPYPQGTLEVQPGGFELLVGDTVTLRAEKRNAVGTPQPAPPVTWSSRHPGIARVDPNGRVTAISPGYAVILASTEGREPMETEIVVSDLSGQRYRAVSAGGANTCLMTEAKSAFCFGEGIFGQLGHGAFVDYQIRPVRVQGEPWDTVTVGDETTCGLQAGKAFCWGIDLNGALGNGEMLPPCRTSPYGSSSYGCSNTPLPVAGGLSFTRLTTGGILLIKATPYTGFSCGLTAEGALHCWGSDGAAQLGDGTQFPLDNPTPRPVAGDIRFRFSVNGFDHACGIDVDDAAWCWGDELLGELGDDAELHEEAATPQRVQGGIRFKQLDAARSHTCGVSVDGVVYCWGSNQFGQLGTDVPLQACTPDTYSPQPCSPAPVPIASSLRFQRVAVGFAHSCAITTEGEAWCWGDATALGAGRADLVPGVERCLGLASRLCVRRPVRVHTRVRFRDIDATIGATCALSTAGHAYCWPLWGVAPGGITTTVPTRVAEPV